MVYVTFCFVRLLSHVDHDGTLRFKVTRNGHANGNSKNEFLDLKSDKTKKYCGRTHIQVPRNNKCHVDHDVTMSFKVIRKTHLSGNS